MSLTGYRLAGTAKTAPSGYIPSLIGIAPEQIKPAGTDTYFEQIDLPDEAINLNTASLTKWVTYDGLPSDVRDPIVAVKGEVGNFYIPLSELEDAVQSAGTPEAIALVKSLRKGPRA